MALIGYKKLVDVGRNGLERGIHVVGFNMVSPTTIVMTFEEIEVYSTGGYRALNRFTGEYASTVISAAARTSVNSACVNATAVAVNYATYLTEMNIGPVRVIDLQK